MQVKSERYIIGIDEVGRGPLAGPVTVGVTCVPVSFDWVQLPGVTDSKQLTATRRKVITAQARQLRMQGELAYEVASVSARIIDRIGIVSAINLAMDRALQRVERAHDPADCRVLLDGGLYAPERYAEQETIIKGDAKEPVIGLASIVAKVQRDRYMSRLGQRPTYTMYDFAQHKGYGTKAHRAAIAEYGPSEQHRKSWG